MQLVSAAADAGREAAQTTPAHFLDLEHKVAPLKAQERDQLLRSLKNRFEKNMQRHQGLTWVKVQAKLEGSPAAMETLHGMESTGGEGPAEGCGCDAAEAKSRWSYCQR